MSKELAYDQLNSYLSSLAQDETNITLLVKISDLYIELNDLDMAQVYLNKASAINRIACLGHQGLLQLNLGQFTQAKETFIEALSHEDTPSLRYNLGFTHFINSDLENAEKILSPIMNGEHHAEAKLLMARIAHGQGDLDKALVLAKEVITNDEDDSEAWGLLAQIYFDMDESDLSIETAQQALALNPDNYDAKLISAMSGLTTQETSTEEIEKLLQVNPEDCRLWFALGSVHMSQGALDIAEQSFKKAIEIYPEFYDCYIALGWCLLLSDNIEEALINYQTAGEIVPELADSWGGLALVAALQEDFLRTELLIQKSKELNSDCFLVEIAESIYFNHKNPINAKEDLISTLKNNELSVSEKLAFIIGGMQETKPLH